MCRRPCFTPSSDNRSPHVFDSPSPCSSALDGSAPSGVSRSTRSPTWNLPQGGNFVRWLQFPPSLIGVLTFFYDAHQSLLGDDDGVSPQGQQGAPRHLVLPA